jgi:hypothetical protein
MDLPPLPNRMPVQRLHILDGCLAGSTYGNTRELAAQASAVGLPLLEIWSQHDIDPAVLLAIVV